MLTCCRILASTGSTFFDLERAEAHQLYFVASLQSALSSRDECSESSLAILLGKATRFSHCSNQFSLIHVFDYVSLALCYYNECEMEWQYFLDPLPAYTRC